MLSRLAPGILGRLALGLSLPLVLVLGCAPSPAIAPGQPTEAQPSGSSSATTAGPDAQHATSVTAATAPPAPAQDARSSGKDKDAGQVGRAVASDAPISTTITQDDILALVNKNVDTFYGCYTPAPGAPKGLRPKVTVKATVGPTGVVNTVEVVDSNTKSPKVDACVVAGFKKLVFQRPAGSGATVFTFPMSFGGMEQVK